MISSVLMSIILFAIWILLSWPMAIKDIISGIMVSILVTLITKDVMNPKEALRKNSINAAGFVRRAFWFLYFVLVFLWECLKANVDVAYRVIHPDLPIRPGTIRMKVGLKSDLGLTFLANTVTLTPGTTCIDIDKEKGLLYVHKLYVKDDERGVAVVDRFEKILSRIFE